MLFNGILNDNGLETKIKLYLDKYMTIPYTTDFYIENVRTDALVDYRFIIIQNTEYEYYIKMIENEILIAAKEVSNIFHWLMPCIYQPKYFLLTNKEEI